MQTVNVGIPLECVYSTGGFLLATLFWLCFALLLSRGQKRKAAQGPPDDVDGAPYPRG